MPRDFSQKTIGGPEINLTPKIWFPGVKDVRVNGESLNRYNAGAEDLVRKLVNQYR